MLSRPDDESGFVGSNAPVYSASKNLFRRWTSSATALTANTVLREFWMLSCGTVRISSSVRPYALFAVEIEHQPIIALAMSSTRAVDSNKKRTVVLVHAL